MMERRFGMFIHWGLYAIPARASRSEWIRSVDKVSNEEYQLYFDIFNPTDYDPKKWAKLAKEAGMKYAVLTAKHHDGFALYDSKVSDYNIVKQTPFKRDVLKELADACKKFGMKLGIYYSQDLDWYERHGGGYTMPPVDCAGSVWSNEWDFGSKDKNFDIYFNEKCLPQIEELFTNYGDFVVAWFDIPFTLSKEQSKKIYDTIKKHQPNCLINTRLGNGKYDYVSFGDNEIPLSKVELNKVNSSDNDINGIKYSKNALYEVCQTLNQSWGYTKYPVWKDISLLKKNKEQCKKLNINFLVNIGPDGDGTFPNDAKKILTMLMKDV